MILALSRSLIPFSPGVFWETYLLCNTRGFRAHHLALSSDTARSILPVFIYSYRHCHCHRHDHNINNNSSHTAVDLDNPSEVFTISIRRFLTFSTYSFSDIPAGKKWRQFSAPAAHQITAVLYRLECSAR
ncbi:hypothetical protein BC827DRAFT_115303 [Russula dissimulans]|nr:hypothetical protein BC827DRAFT_115303 [Russula dissimulans]